MIVRGSLQQPIQKVEFFPALCFQLHFRKSEDDHSGTKLKDQSVISDCYAFRLGALYVTNRELQRAAKLLALAATTATTQLSLV
jgi:hypothetical protein